MKIIMIYDQIQSGAGIKDDHDIPLGAKKEAVGPAVMMEPFLKKVDGKVVACLYCGDGTYLKNPDEVSRKLCAMVNKLKPDVVMCGPCFNYLNYGKMAARIVDVPDASKVLNASIVTYANEAKMKYANVSKDTLKQYGAVSENTAREMAEGVAKANNADVAAGISGIAGPTGGTEDKPVGMVCFGFYIDGKVFSDTKHFGNIGRNNVRDESVEYVLDVLIKELS